MKLQDQCCSMEQADRLKELGVAMESLFYHTDSDWGVMPRKSIDFSGNPSSAFTVAELGVMIGKGTNAAALLYDAVQDRMNRSHSFTIVLGVQFVANCLIGMLETGRLTVEEVNARLCAK